MTKETKVIEFTDVKGKKQLYLKLTKGEKSVFINIGEKTYNSVKDLETAENEKPNTKKVDK